MAGKVVCPHCGAALDPITEEFWGRLGYAVIQGYGLTETTSLISVNHPFKVGKGSVGKVLAGQRMAVDHGEYLEGVNAVAASVPGGLVWVAGFSGRLTPARLDEAAALLERAVGPASP